MTEHHNAPKMRNAWSDPEYRKRMVEKQKALGLRTYN
jgi:hypothetical protein